MIVLRFICHTGGPEGTAPLADPTIPNSAAATSTIVVRARQRRAAAAGVRRLRFTRDSRRMRIRIYWNETVCREQRTLLKFWGTYLRRVFTDYSVLTPGIRPLRLSTVSASLALASRDCTRCCERAYKCPVSKAFPPHRLRHTDMR
jgi:hypothetical protein